MDSFQKFEDKCLKHPQNNIEYMKIYNTGSSQSQPFFCCQQCVNSESSFASNDFLNINHVINTAYEEILHQWPPLNNQLKIDMFKIMKSRQSREYVVAQVIEHFNKLKTSINKSIDMCQKKMIQIAETFPSENDNIISKEDFIKKYEAISQLRVLRDSLLNSNTSIEEKEKICNELIEQQTQQSKNTNKLLDNLLNELRPKIAYEPQLISQSILSTIDSINFFHNIPSAGKIDVKLLKTNYNDGQNNLYISYNSKNQPQVTIIKNSFCENTVCDIILERHLKYVFRFQIEADNLSSGKFLFLGLIDDQRKNTHTVYESSLCYFLEKQNEQICLDNQFYFGRTKIIRGDEFVLSEQRQVEMRVCIEEQILEILDYPKYNFQLGISDSFSPLIHQKDFRVCIGISQAGNKVTLIDSLIVNYFD